MEQVLQSLWLFLLGQLGQGSSEWPELGPRAVLSRRTLVFNAYYLGSPAFAGSLVYVPLTTATPCQKVENTLTVNSATFPKPHDSLRAFWAVMDT